VTPFTETRSVSRHNGGDSEEEKQWMLCFLEPPSGGFFISRGMSPPGPPEFARLAYGNSRRALI